MAPSYAIPFLVPLISPLSVLLLMFSRPVRTCCVCPSLVAAPFSRCSIRVFLLFVSRSYIMRTPPPVFYPYYPCSTVLIPKYNCPY